MTSRSPRMTWRHRAMRWLGVAAGALAVSSGDRPSIATAAADVANRPAPAQIPPAWRDFAGNLQRQFQERLASGSDAAARFQEAMGRLAADQQPNPSIVVRVWITAIGQVERVEIEGFPSGSVSHDLAVAVSGDGRPPPPDMPQPLRLRLSLGSQGRPEKGQ